MRTPYFILLLGCVVGISFAAGVTPQKIRVTPTNIQSMPFIIVSDTSAGTGHFIITASLKDQDQNTLQLGSLWLYDGPKYISDCLVHHGREIEGRVIFTFSVATNYFGSSQFFLRYGTTNTWAAAYWFYLKDFGNAKRAA